MFIRAAYIYSPQGEQLKSELNDSEKEILRFLGSSKTKEIFRLKELIRATSKRKVEYNVTGTKQKRKKTLVKLGLVEISPHEHGKARKVWLTEEGWRYLDNLELLWKFQELMDRLYPNKMPNEKSYRGLLVLYEEVLTTLLKACWIANPDYFLELQNATQRIFKNFREAKYASEKSVSDMLHDSLDKARHWDI